MLAVRPCVVALVPFVVSSWVGADTNGSFDVQPNLVPAALSTGEAYGGSVAIDGERLAVGAPVSIFFMGNGPGRVVIFERQAGVWVETASIAAPGLPNGSRFGGSVELCGDTLFVTAGTGSTEAFVFEFDGTAWNQAASVVAAPPNNESASDVEVSGATLVLGTGNSAPRVHVFERTGTDWSQAQETVLVASDGQNLGTDVAIDGDTLVAGAPTAKVAGQFQAGRAHVFQRTAGVWTEVASLTSVNSQSFGLFGWSVALCGDWIAVGSPASELPQLPNHSGYFEVFRRVGGAWTPEQLFANPTPGLFEQFGTRVAASAGRLIVSAPTDTDEVWLYTLEGDVWTERALIVPPLNTPLAGFGAALDIDQDVFVVGDPRSDVLGGDAGTAYVYERVPPTPIAYCTAKTTTEGCVPAVGWNGGASLTGSDDFAVLARDVPPGKTGLFFWGTSGQAAVPFLGGTLCIAPSLTRGPVSISLGNAPCDAGFVLPFTQALMSQEGFDVCQTVHGQWWMRDPQNPDGTGVALTDGIEFEIDF